MKTAVAVWNGRVSPVFDVSREVVVLTIENRTVTERRNERIDAPTAGRRMERLMELGVGTLICGAISAPLYGELGARGVRVIGFVAGDVEDVVRAFLAGELPAPGMSMPGCGRRRNRFRGGRGRGGGRRGDGWGRAGRW